MRISCRTSQSLPDTGIESLKVIALDNFYVNIFLLTDKIYPNQAKFDRISRNTLHKAIISLNVRLAK
jgi:hypothetical protein